MNVKIYNDKSSGIDLFRYIASALVVVIHVIPTAISDNYNGAVNFVDLIQLIARSAVPFFLITSSFFLFNGVDSNKIKKYIVRILYLYAFWLLVNLPITFYFRIWIFRDRLIWAIFNQVRAFFVTSTFPGSWYLMACITSALIVYFLCKKLKTGMVLLLTLSLEIFVILTTTYGNLFIDTAFYNVFKNLISESQVSILAGLFYFAMGKYLLENFETLKEVKKIHLKLIMLLSFIFMVLEYFIVQELGFYYTMNRSIFLIPFTTSLFLLLIQYNPRIKYSSSFRKISVVVYCSQWNFIVFYNLLERFNIAFPVYINYIFVLSASTSLGIVLLLLSKKERFIWLRKVM